MLPHFFVDGYWILPYLFEYKSYFFVLKIHPKSQVRLIQEVKRCGMRMYAAAVRVLSGRRFAPSCVCMHAMTIA